MCDVAWASIRRAEARADVEVDVTGGKLVRRGMKAFREPGIRVDGLRSVGSC